MAEYGVPIGGLEETLPIMDVDRYTPFPWPWNLGEDELRIIRRRLEQAFEEEAEKEKCDNYDPVYTVE